MSERRERPDRRREPRQPLAGRVWWSQVGVEPTFSGWLSDGADSSVSFITAARTSPGSGSRIELIRPGQSRRGYRVVRTAPYDAELSLVVCCSYKE